MDFYGSEPQRVWYVRDPAGSATTSPRIVSVFGLQRRSIEPLGTEAEFLSGAALAGGNSSEIDEHKRKVRRVRTTAGGCPPPGVTSSASPVASRHRRRTRGV